MAAAQPANGEAVREQDIKETACGITEFVCPDLLGFSGVFKKRYTDFLVNEILPSGQVVHLDDDAQASKRETKKHASSGSSKHGPKDSADQIKSQGSKVEASAPLGSQPEGSAGLVASDLPTTESTMEGPRVSGPEETAIDYKIAPPSNRPGESASQQPETKPDTETESSTNLAPHKSHSQITPSVPISMQDFEAPVPPVSPVPKTENVAPHMRIPPPTPSVPMSMRDPDASQVKAGAPRIKETVRIRQTSQGWVEIDEKADQELKAVEGADNASTMDYEPLEKASAQTEVTKEPEVKEESFEKPVRRSTQASWQNFAQETSAEAEASTGFQLKSEDLTALLSYFTSDVVDQVLSLYDRILKSPHRKAKDYGIVKSAIIDRHTRSRIHQDLRRIFESRLESTTDSDGAMVISVMPEKSNFYGRTPIDEEHGDKDRANKGRGRNDRVRDGNKNNRRRGDGRTNRHDQWAERGGEYLHFSLYKENKDTMEAISWLGKQLEMRASSFQFAGTKDRRGVTVQRVSVHRILAQRMAAAGRSLRNARVGNFEYQPHPLRLGELTGNEFIITLRDCNFHYPMPVDANTLVNTAQDVVGEAIKNLAAHGFINYFGLQRFGTFSTSTDKVGLKILQGDFKGAVDDILYFNPASLATAQDPMASAKDKVSQDDQARAFAIESFQSSGRSQSALRDIPRKFSAEYSVIQHLGQSKSSQDFSGAIKSINRNMRLMYVHAYQSLVWNMAASERWKRFRSAVVEGDLVLVDEHKDKMEPEAEGETIDADGEAIIRPSGDDRAIAAEDIFTRARALTREEAVSGMYTIFDIVLPTPGFDILYPANEMERFYEEFMGSERGGGLDPHNMRREWKDASLSGGYRKLLARPSKDFSFEVKAYEDDEEQFVQTDLDRIQKAKEERDKLQHSKSVPLRADPAKPEANSSEPLDTGNSSQPEEKPEVPSPSDSEHGGVSLSKDTATDYKVAVILKLQLGTSQYATMALRELMKHGGVLTYKQDFSGGRS